MDINFLFTSENILGNSAVISILTGLLTAIATALAAWITGHHANKIAKQNNKNYWHLDSFNREIDALNNLQISYNNFSHYLNLFYSDLKDNERVNTLKPEYNYSSSDYALHTEDKIIINGSIRPENVRRLGELVFEQTKEYSFLFLDLNNQLLLTKQYFREDEYTQLEKTISNYKHDFDFILDTANLLLSNKNNGNLIGAKSLVHLKHRALNIQSIYKEKGKFIPDSDNDLNFNEPTIIKYISMFEKHMKINKFLTSKINKTLANKKHSI